MAQVYATSFGWTCAHPMKRKGDAHETLSLVFQRDGVPPTMVTDDSKEQTKGEFRQKLKEADCHLQVTEPYYQKRYYAPFMGYKFIAYLCP